MRLRFAAPPPAGALDLQPVRTDARGRRRRTAAAAMEGADPAASTGVFTLDYEALGLNR